MVDVCGDSASACGEGEEVIVGCAVKSSEGDEMEDDEDEEDEEDDEDCVECDGALAVLGLMNGVLLSDSNRENVCVICGCKIGGSCDETGLDSDWACGVSV